MGLLHSLHLSEAQGVFWELSHLAEEVGVPLPPPLTEAIQKLPPLITSTLGGDFGPALALLGPAAGPLGAVLKNPAVQSLIKGDLEGVKSGLLGYVGQLEGMKDELFNRFMEATGLSGALGQAKDLLGGVRGALGQAEGLLHSFADNPLASLLDVVKQASPELANVLGYAENALGNIESRLSGADNLLGNLSKQMLDLTNLRGLANKALGAVNLHLGGLDDLFKKVGEMLP